MSGALRRNGEEILDAIETATHRMRRALKGRSEQQSEHIRRTTNDNRDFDSTHTDADSGSHPGDHHAPAGGDRGNGNGSSGSAEITTVRGSNGKTTVYDPETGRPISERGTIVEDFGSSPRGDNATEVGHMGGEGYDGGHLGAHRFFGDTPDQGIVPQAANLNRGAWKRMENEWARMVEKGYQVDYDIEVFPPGARVPDSFEVSYRVWDPSTGELVRRGAPEFENAGGQVFIP